ncbi:MAG: tRNA (N6-threonylcarbamoyladenosine(37)-N6)-methyltransferase TrmO [Desulfobacterales bacterium]|nr:MAG: tRNA (N6-threonylcarbamoyladenosine(37)-N6)-methyltransferase TrmO [Desulfobacterales bacterium]
MKIGYQPIGVVHSPFTEIEGMPIQPSRAKGVSGTAEVFPQYVEGLADLEGFSHIILLCHLHRSRGFRLKVVPFLDTELWGLFATRAPNRPNPIGLSVVCLVDIEQNRLSVKDIDILDGTPVLDIKPYVPEFNERTEATLGWLGSARKRKALSGERFK